MSTLAILRQPRKRFYCPDFRGTTWALRIDPPFAKLIRDSSFAKVVVMSERSTEQIRELLDSLYRTAAFKVTESTVTSKGVIIVNYERAGAVPTGSL
jgi:hypothetical protein